MASASYRHEVSLQIHGTPEQIRTRLPAGIAVIEEATLVEETVPAEPVEPHTERWLRVRIRAERLDWLPGLLASLDRPFLVEQPEELRSLVTALADRLAASGRRRSTAR